MGLADAGLGGPRSSCSARRNSGQDEGPVCCDRGRGAMARADSGRCAASDAIPAADFAAVQSVPGVRILLLTCGAKGTRTPDPLLANRRQVVRRCLSPQVTVLGRAPVSDEIRSCCCTFALYGQRRQLADRRSVERKARHCSTRMAHRGPGALARRPSPVTSSQPSVSASATYAES